MKPKLKVAQLTDNEVPLSSSSSEGTKKDVRHVKIEGDLEDELPRIYINRFGSILDPNYADLYRNASQILHEEDSTEEFNLGPEASYVKQNPLEEMPNFFDQLGDMPSLSDLSSEIEDDLSEEEEQQVMEEDITIDKGVFVDPLTGDILSSSSKPDIAIPEIIQTKEDEEAEVEVEIEIDSDLEIPSALDFDMGYEQSPEDRALEALMEIGAQQKVVVIETVDFTEDRKREEALITKMRIERFLCNLIDKAVEIAEYVDPITILRGNLDKKKLFAQLRNKVEIMFEEQRDRIFLNRKVVEHFRRKKSFRPITEDNPETLQYEIEKYKLATLELDAILGKEEEKKVITSTHINTLTMRESELRRNAEEEVEDFETMVKNALTRDSFEKLPGIVNNQLHKMARIRNEISDVRFRLIEKSHSVAVLQDKIEEMENLGNGLRMRDFVHLQTETQALDKKIEERNAELNKFRTRCNGDFHILAHMREKQEMLCNTISLQQVALEELLEHKKAHRNFLFKLKLRREQIRKEIQEFRFQGGLLDKPKLMLDYDETVRRITEKRTHNEHLKWKYESDMKKLLALEAKCLGGKEFSISN